MNTFFSCKLLAKWVQFAEICKCKPHLANSLLFLTDKCRKKLMQAVQCGCCSGGSLILTKQHFYLPGVGFQKTALQAFLCGKSCSVYTQIPLTSFI